GAELALFASVGDRDRRATESPWSTLFGIAPHVGYVIPMNDIVSFWPRAGVAYFSELRQGDRESSLRRQLSIALDAAMVITPAPHLGVTAAIVGDAPITGSYESDTMARTHGSSFYFGVSGGLLAYF